MEESRHFEVQEPARRRGLDPSGALRPRRVLRPLPRAALAALLAIASVGPVRAEPTSRAATKEAAVGQARRLVNEDEGNRQNMQRAIALLSEQGRGATEDIRVYLCLAEAYYRAVSPESDIKEGAPYFEKVQHFARKALAIDPDSAEAHYWYGLSLLREAQSSTVRAFFIVKHAIRELDLVRKSAPEYDHGGAARVLGLLFYTAPSWTPFGDLDRAVEFEAEATGIDPSYPLNRLYLANAYKKRGDRAAAIREYRRIVADGAARAAPFREAALDSLKALGAHPGDERRVVAD